MQLLDLKTTISLKNIENNLENLQGNILIKHGKLNAAHVLLSFREKDPQNVATWIKNKLKSNLTNALDQLGDVDPENYPPSKEEYIGFGLSAQGYRFFNLAPLDDQAFKRGMHNAPLNDPSPDTWDEFYQQPEIIHALLIVAHDRTESIKNWLDKILKPDAPIEILGIEWGQELGNEIEHFGFVDGISQPIFIDEQIAPVQKKQEGKLMWNPTTPLRLVLKEDPYSENGFGSFLVFRKLKQNVKRFNKNLDTLADHLSIDTHLAGALLMGRFKDGTPLAISDKPGLGPLNNFNFDHDQVGSKCPFHSHIRKVNPRGEHDDAAETPDLENRIARRSIHYGNIGDENVGMLFMCFQSNMLRQFELIQMNWSNFADFGRLRVGMDPITGQSNSWEIEKPQKWPTEWGGSTFSNYHLASCVEVKGGAYFFTPSIDALDNLDAAL